MANSLGSMSGAGLSGYLAEPSGRVPLLGKLDLFQEEPYLLPGLVVFDVSILASAMVFVFVPEVSPIISAAWIPGLHLTDGADQRISSRLRRCGRQRRFDSA
jgi:hypothetical protein